ncbi:MAG: Tfp pilus assembly protein FimT/FimU [Candidatus Contendobacter sp.]|nr:Tfp pilus assembly protein FimT/FimU [Candidatus Contendobacter sp.]
MKFKGFTLIELIITLAIAAIVMTIGVPAFQDMIRNNRMIAQTNDFISALSFTRSEAIKRGRPVVLCKSSGGAACATTGPWDQGWMIFVDTNNNAAVDAGEEILRIHDALSGGNTLVGNSNVVTYISYSSDGVSRLKNGGTFQSGTLTFGLCNSSHQQNTIVINETGRARIAKITCS